MTARSVRPRLIEHKLPVYNSIILFVVILGFGIVALKLARQATLAAAATRLTSVGKLLGDLLTQTGRQLSADIAVTARDSTLVTLLQHPSAANRRRASAVLERMKSAPSSPESVALLDYAGGRILVSGDTSSYTNPSSPGAIPSHDAPAVGPLQSVGGRSGYFVTSPVRSEGQVLGYLVELRRITGARQIAEQLRNLIGPGASILLGSNDGLWRDVGGAQQASPMLSTSRRGVVEYEQAGGITRFGVLTPVEGTPWLVLVDLSRRDMLRPVATITRIVVVFAVAFFGIGVALTWLFSRRLTRRLRDLTDATAGVAAGDYHRRVAAEGDDEVAQLARAFNNMAERVAQAQETLETRVRERTRELNESEGDVTSGT